MVNVAVFKVCNKWKAVAAQPGGAFEHFSLIVTNRLLKEQKATESVLITTNSSSSISVILINLNCGQLSFGI